MNRRARAGFLQREAGSDQAKDLKRKQKMGRSGGFWALEGDFGHGKWPFKEIRGAANSWE
jgi:hypothetical protein